MTWGKTNRTRSADPHAGLIAVLVVITTLGIAAKVLAPARQAFAEVAQTGGVPEPVRDAWFSLSFEDIPR